MNLDLNDLKLTRRGLLQKAGAVGLGAAALTAFAGRPAEAAVATVADVLNFALNLEYLEAEFYTYAVMGTGINGVSTPYGTVTATGTVTGNKTAVTFPTNDNGFAATIAQQIMLDEQSHVALLQSVLGGLAVPEPNINLSALDAALAGLTSFQRFLVLSRAFEDTGVSAYSGGSTLLRSNPTALQAAAQILAVEAYHASNIRLMIAQDGLTIPKTDPMDVPPPPASGGFFFAVTNALAITRSTSQVLGIAYGQSTPTAFAPAGVTSGGFFPNGTNGNIKST
jgi:hypothetical protein